MRKFLTELRGKTVTTTEGQVLGDLDNLVIDTVTGVVAHILVKPREGVETGRFQKDAAGRLILPCGSMRAVKDVILVETTK